MAKRPQILAIASLLLFAPASARGESDPLAKLGVQVSAGAAPGYVADHVCRTCHAKRYDSFQHVGMARSFAKPAADNLRGDFEHGEFYDARSKRHYDMRWDGKSLIFRRYQTDADGKPINEFETKVAWVIGSGHYARTYLYQTPSGELYELPIQWYRQGKHWGMAPGYARADHDGVLRPVRRECMFCHNAYPEVPKGSDAHWQPQVFPAELPQGIGCQRCHGPGAAHVRAALEFKPPAVIRAAIVNPARLPVERRNEVCFQCHMLPAVALIGPRRFDRGDYSFRPGQELSDYILHVDIDVEGQTTGDRFEIDHQAYRLVQSECFKKSNGRLTCLTCHDPHQRVPRDETRDHYRDACLTCHKRHATRPAGVDAKVDMDDCVSCHMPRRRTDDVVQVVMTDHLIARGPFDEKDLTAPKKETTPTITGIHFLWPDLAPKGLLGKVYLAVATLRAAPSESALNFLIGALPKLGPSTAVPDLDVARGLLHKGRVSEASTWLERLAKSDPGNARVHDWLGLADLRLGRKNLAEGEERTAVKLAPRSPEANFDLGVALLAQNHKKEALTSIEQAIALRPNMVIAWYRKGEMLLAMKRYGDAVQALERALDLDPGMTSAYRVLAVALKEDGKPKEARRYLEVGSRVARQPALVKAALEALPPEPPASQAKH